MWWKMDLFLLFVRRKEELNNEVIENIPWNQTTDPRGYFRNKSIYAKKRIDNEG